MWISPTRLAAALAGSGGTPEATHGCVIVETNYRVCVQLQNTTASGKANREQRIALSLLRSVSKDCASGAMQVR